MNDFVQIIDSVDNLNIDINYITQKGDSFFNWNKEKIIIDDLTFSIISMKIEIFSNKGDEVLITPIISDLKDYDIKFYLLQDLSLKDFWWKTSFSKDELSYLSGYWYNYSINILVYLIDDQWKIYSLTVRKSSIDNLKNFFIKNWEDKKVKLKIIGSWKYYKIDFYSNNETKNIPKSAVYTVEKYIKNKNNRFKDYSDLEYLKDSDNINYWL